jgi:hypothetical protein
LVFIGLKDRSSAFEWAAPDGMTLAMLRRVLPA